MSNTVKKIPTTKNIYQKKNMTQKATIQSKKKKISETATIGKKSVKSTENKMTKLKKLKNFVHGFINGESGTGKTSSIIIPAVCNDLDQKSLTCKKERKNCCK